MRAPRQRTHYKMFVALFFFSIDQAWWVRSYWRCDGFNRVFYLWFCIKVPKQQQHPDTRHAHDLFDTRLLLHVASLRFHRPCHKCACVNNNQWHTIILNREVITLRMHVVNLILFENHMSEWSVFAQHNSSASTATARTQTVRERACHVLVQTRRVYTLRYQNSIGIWHEIRGHRNESWK